MLVRRKLKALFITEDGSQRAAQRLDVDPAVLSAIVNGRKVPSDQLRKKFEKKYGRSIDELIAE